MSKVRKIEACVRVMPCLSWFFFYCVRGEEIKRRTVTGREGKREWGEREGKR